MVKSIIRIFFTLLYLFISFDDDVKVLLEKFEVINEGILRDVVVNSHILPDSKVKKLSVSKTEELIYIEQHN